MEDEKIEISNTKKYFWLKLKDDFFEEKYVKVLRIQENFEKMLIVYLKMQLKSLKTEGYIQFQGLMASPIEELALDIDENVDIVKATVEILIRMKVVEELDDGTLFLVELQKSIGKECKSAERTRKYRERKNEQMSQGDDNMSHCNTEIEKDININLDIKKKIDNKFIKPTLEEITEFCFENKINIDCEYFLNYYESNGWKIGRNMMKDWKATIRNWSKRNFNSTNGVAESKGGGNGTNGIYDGTSKTNGYTERNGKTVDSYGLEVV